MQNFSSAKKPLTIRSAGLSVIGLSVLALVSCSKDSSPTRPSGPSQGAVVTVRVNDYFYDPVLVILQPGDTVRWVLTGNLRDHTVTDDGGAFDSGFVLTGPGANFQRQFTLADLGKRFNYSCRTHEGCCGMRGSVLVGANALQPTFNVTIPPFNSTRTPPPTRPTFSVTTPPFNRTPTPPPPFRTPPPPPPPTY